MSEPKSTSVWLSWLLLASAVLTLASAVLLAFWYLNDLYAAHQVPGIWMALAWYTNHGVFYPPLESADGYYGGTRYMPLFFLLLAGLVRVGASYLVAAKLASAASVALLAAAVGAVARRLTGRWRDAIILAGLVLAVPQGLGAVVLPHCDALSAALALWGLLLLRTEQERCRIVLPALLFSLALAAKFTTVAGLGAALIYLLGRDRWAAFRLLLLVLLLSLAGFLLLQAASAGRFLDNLRSVGGGGLGWQSITQGPAKMLHMLERSGGFLLLLPLALVSLLSRLRPFRFDLWDWNLLASCATALVILTSPGTEDNHLIELEAAGIVICGRFLADPEKTTPASSLLLLLGKAVLLLVFLLGCRFHAGTWRAAESEGAIPVRDFVAALPAGARILGETPTAAILLGQRPVMVDSFNFRLLAERGLINERVLAEKLARREFAVLVLLVGPKGETFWPEQHFGQNVTEAIKQHYHFERRLGVYSLFVPAPP